MIKKIIVAAILSTAALTTPALACEWSDGTYTGTLRGKTFIFTFDKACSKVTSVGQVEGETPETVALTQRGKRLVANIEQLVITFSGNGKRLTVQGPGGGMLSMKMKRVK